MGLFQSICILFSALEAGEDKTGLPTDTDPPPADRPLITFGKLHEVVLWKQRTSRTFRERWWSSM